MHLKKLSKLVNFCVATLLLKMEESNATFSASYALLLTKGEDTTETHIKGCVPCVEKAL